MYKSFRWQKTKILFTLHVFIGEQEQTVIKLHVCHFTLEVRLEGRMRSNEGLGTPGGGGWPIWLPFPPPENVPRIPDHRSRPHRPKNG